MRPEQNVGKNAEHIDECRNSDQQYVLHPVDDDLFVRTGRQIIAACQLGIGLELWLQEVDELLNEVRNWCRGHASQVQACYVAPLGSRVTLFFVPVSDGYDFDLGSDLADLNTALVQQFNTGMVETRQIPRGEQDRFVRPETSRLIYGETTTAHRTMVP